MKKRAKIHLLPTDKESHITFDKESSSCYSYGLHYLDNASGSSNRTKTERQHLYITTDDEIKEGDWFLNVKSGDIDKRAPKASGRFAMNSNRIYNDPRKIIATTDPELNLPQPSKEFIEEYCRVGGIDEVDVEYELYHGIDTSIAEINAVSGDGSLGWKGQDDLRDIRLKVDSHNTITIHPIKEMKTIEQAEQRALELYPIHPVFDVDRLKPLREAYLQGWEEAQQDKQTCGFCVEQATELTNEKHSESLDTKENEGSELPSEKQIENKKLREAAEKVVKKSAWYDLEHISIDFANAVVELEKTLK